MRLLDYWCKACKKSNDNIGEEESKWLNALKKYDFAFMIPLRNVDKSKSSVIDMICHDSYFVFHKSLHSQIREVISGVEYKCLIILDGLDEWKPTEDVQNLLTLFGIPNFDAMSNNVVLISSRPWKLDEIRESMRDVDRMVDIKGLNAKGVKIMFDEISSRHYSKAPHEMNGQYDQFQKEYPHSFASTPILLTAAVHLWHVKAEVLKSKTRFFLSLVQLLFKAAKVDKQTTNQNVSEEIKDILKEYKSLQSYGWVLIHLGKVAYEDLISKSPHLVFEEDVLSNAIGDNNLQIMINIGLLKKFETFPNANVRLSFFHKCLQELLAALYVISSGPPFIEQMSSFQKILDLQYLITFISGFSPKFGYEISEKIAKSANEDKMIKFYRETFDYEKHDVIRRLYNLILDCYQEAKISKWTLYPTYQVSDIYVRKDDDIDNAMYLKLTKQLLSRPLKGVRSLYFRSIPNHDSDGILDTVLKDFLQENQQLESLYIKGVDGDRCFETADDFNIESKKALLLDNITVTNAALIGLEKNVKRAQELKTLGLWNIRHKYPLPSMQIFLHTLPSVCNINTLDFSCLTNREDGEHFIDILPSMQQLQNIQYGGDKTKRDELDNRVVKKIFVSLSKVLKRLWLNYLILDTDSLDGLNNMTCLKKMELREVKMEDGGWENLIQNAEHIDHRLVISLIGTDIPENIKTKVKDDSSIFEMDLDTCSYLHWGKLDRFIFTKDVTSEMEIIYHRSKGKE